MPSPLWKKSYSWLFAVLIFTVPSNLFLKYAESTAYVRGLSIDYLIPKLHLSEVVVLTLLGLWTVEIIISLTRPYFKKTFFTTGFIMLISFLTLFFARQLLTFKPIVSVISFLHGLEALLLFIFIFTHPYIIKTKLFIWSLVATLLFQSTLGLYQWYAQQSLLGYLFFGEPQLQAFAGLAKATWWGGAEVILPYGTTAHPNVLGGLLGLFSLLLLRVKNSYSFTSSQRLLIYGSCGLSLLILLLTQSWSAVLATLIGLIIYRGQVKLSQHIGLTHVLALFLIPLGLYLSSLVVTNNPSIDRRLTLNRAAVQMLKDEPIVGVGLNMFTTKLEVYAPPSEVVRFVQPAHHVGLLWLAETGLLGVMLVVSLCWWLTKHYQLSILPMAWLVLLPIAGLDHYLLTIQSGVLLGVIWLSCHTQINKKS